MPAVGLRAGGRASDPTIKVGSSWSPRAEGLGEALGRFIRLSGGGRKGLARWGCRRLEAQRLSKFFTPFDCTSADNLESRNFMAENKSRKLFSGRLKPIAHCNMTHRISYSQPVFTKGEMGFERIIDKKATKGEQHGWQIMGSLMSVLISI